MINLETVLGKEHPSTLASMYNLALMRSDQGKYEQAEETHRQTLGPKEMVLSKEHPSTLTSVNNLTLVLSDQGKYEQMEEMHRQALELRETVLGKEHPSTPTGLNYLALMLSRHWPGQVRAGGRDALINTRAEGYGTG
jgi:tetratricopeptide (TPR) repeat protein